MKPAREPTSSRPKPRASLKKPHESCRFAVLCWPSYEENRPWSEISFSLRNLPVSALYFGLTAWVQPSHLSSPRPSPVPGANLVLIHRPLSSLPLSRRYASFGAMAVGTNGVACGHNCQCTANNIGYAASWSQHTWTPYRLITSMVWVHPGRKAARAGQH